MKIKSIHLKNFKRFTDLEIRDIPESCKLVMVVGPNGCGKSSVFDGLMSWHSSLAGFGVLGDEKYSRKSTEDHFNWSDNTKVQIHNNEAVSKNSFYVRSAYRNDPDFAMSNISAQRSPEEQPRFRRMIENDQTVGQNFQRLVYDSTTSLYLEANNLRTVEDLRLELIGGLQNSMHRVFGDLELLNITDPFGHGTFTFRKGVVDSYLYKNLSGGEKSAFDLLLDMHLKKKYYPNAIYCIDEIETHLHTRVQGLILKEIVNILPDTCQLWCTTHSLGVIRAAQDIEAATPGSVSLISFDGVSADDPVVLRPITVGRVAWGKLLSITLDDLSDVVAPNAMILCEGSRIGTRRINFDATIYDRIFSHSHAHVQFVSGGNCLEVQKNATDVQAILKAVIPGTKIVPLLDRDDMSEAEVQQHFDSGSLVLSLRNIESYLLADDTIEAFLKSQNAEGKLAEILDQKAQLIIASVSRGNPADDMKSIAGQLYSFIKTSLSLTRLGNTSDAFLRDTMSQFVLPGYKTYDILKADIIDKL